MTTWLVEVIVITLDTGEWELLIGSETYRYAAGVLTTLDEAAAEARRVLRDQITAFRAELDDLPTWDAS